MDGVVIAAVAVDDEDDGMMLLDWMGRWCKRQRRYRRCVLNVADEKSVKNIKLQQTEVN